MTKSLLDSFIGNICSEQEKRYRLGTLTGEIQQNNIDKDFIPYLKQLNDFDIVTTRCCTGHGNEGSGSRQAYLSFRSCHSPEYTIDYILKPFVEKYFDAWIEIALDGGRLSYVLRLKNSRWEEQIKYLIEILKAKES